MVHNFISDDKSRDGYNRVIFCTKCGQVAWDYNRDEEWCIENLQSKIKECFDEAGKEKSLKEVNEEMLKKMLNK